MSKKYTLRKNWEFKAIIALKKQFVNRSLVLYYRGNNTNLKVGISISKKFANAVLRNKYKRQVRNILKDLKIWTLKYDVVIILRKPFLEMEFEQKINQVKKIFERL